MTTHECPHPGSGWTNCCHMSVFDLPNHDRLTETVELVDCVGRG